MAAAAGELPPLTEEQTRTLRAKLCELLEQTPAVTPREAAAAVSDWSAWATPGRVKKVLTKLRAEFKAEAEAAATPPHVAHEPASLPAWPSSLALRDYLDKGDTSIFTLGEKLRSRASAPAAATTSDANFDFRMSLVLMANHWETQRVRVFLLYDPGETTGLLLVLRGVHRLATGPPLFDVEYSTHRPLNKAQLLSRAAAAADAWGSKRLVVYTSPEEWETWWLPELEANERKEAPRLAGLRCSSVAVPQPAEDRTSTALVAQNKLASKVCAACGGAATMTCSRCKGAHYCSEACNRLAWKTHKKVCRASAAEAAEEEGTVTLPVTSPVREDGMVMMSLNIAQGLGFGPMVDLKSDPVNVHGAERFVVKAQVPCVPVAATLSRVFSSEFSSEPTPGMPILIYDERRSFTTHLYASPAFDAVLEVTRRAGALRGLKSYLYARREGPALRLWTSEVPPQEEWMRRF